MTKEELKKLVLNLLKDFAEEEEVWGDDAQLCVNPDNLTVTLAADAEARPDDDCYSVMEFLQPSPAEPGSWIPDTEAVDALVSEYYPD